MSLTADRIASIRRAVAAGRAESISAYVSQAVDRHADEDRLVALLDEMDAELGPPSAEAEQWADGVMDRLDNRIAARRSKRR